MLHRYNSKDVSTCFNSRRIVLVGDSTIRQIYWAIAKKLDAKAAKEGLQVAGKHIDLRFQSSNVDLMFIWDPYLNSTKLRDELTLYRGDVHSVENGNTTQTASVIVIGGGLWDVRYTDAAPLKHFAASIDEIVSYTRSRLQDKTRSISQSSADAPVERDLLLFTPVQLPLYEALSPVRAKAITPTKVDLMNDNLRQVSGRGGHTVLWSYSLMTLQQKSAYEEGGLHVIGTVTNQQADVLLNLRCNAKLNALGHYPFDRTCCSRYTRPNEIQWTLISCGLWGFPVLSVIVGKGRLLESY